ncbi:MAG TPA: hypothetical protein DCQ70_14975 [Halieaceae bacterium]|nr:hypothetical protein [Haliea sp.]HAN69781.1 hypothetical protein [Halieaceae bacterium]
MYRLPAVLLAALVLSLAAGCSTAPSQPDTLTPAETAALEERVRGRWQALIDRDFGAVYAYASPNYRAVFSKSMFIRNFSYSLDWQLTAVEVLAYDAEAAVASVAVRVMSKPIKQTSVSAQFGFMPSTVRERWVSINGEWWHSASG